MSTKFLLFSTNTPDENAIAPFNTLYGVGAPLVSDGADGDYYFRHDTAGEAALYKKVSGNWVEVTGGEANTASSLGTGQSIVGTKSGVDLRFKSIVAGANILLSSTANELTISGPAPGEANTASNLGSGSQVFASKAGVDLRFRSLTAGTNITLTQNASDIVINATSGGDVSGGVNIGTGEEVFKAKVGSDLQFRRLNAGTGIAIAGNANDLTISASGEANTASNLGAGEGVFANKTGVDLRFKTLVAGSGVTLNSTSTEITISSTGGGGGEANTGANVGSGTGLLFRDKTGVTLNFKSLIAGSGISITNNANDITLSTAGAGITSLNGLTGGSQTFANDTNVTLSSAGSVHTLGWTGQLSLARGGTGAPITAVNGGIIYSNASTLAVTPAGTANQLLVSAGAGTPVWKTLTAGTNVTITPGVSTLTIDVAGGGGGEVNTASNLGAGTGLFASKVGVDLRFKSLVAGTNVTINNDSNTVTINASGGGGGGQETQWLSFDSGNILVKASGSTADLALITAVKDFALAGISRVTMNKPTTVKYDTILVNFTAAETTGRSTVRVDVPDNFNAATLLGAVRPIVARLTNDGNGIGALTGTILMNTPGTLECQAVGYTAATAQRAALYF